MSCNTLTRYRVTYEYTGKPRFGAEKGMRTTEDFDRYSIDIFVRAAPEGWIIRAIDPYEVPDA